MNCRASHNLPGVRCASMSSQNPDRPDGRQLHIGVAVVSATGEHRRPDPIAVLMGGPGEDAIGAAEIYIKRFAPLRRDRDILLVDQRGAGRSGALRCDLISTGEPTANLRDLFPLAAVEECRRKLLEQTDLTQYTFGRFANDLEQVRLALGYTSLNLFAGSYGTRAAQVFLRLYPLSVRSVLWAVSFPSTWRPRFLSQKRNKRHRREDVRQMRRRLDV